MDGKGGTSLLIAAVLLVGASALGYWLGAVVEERASPSPEASPPAAEEPPPEGSPSPSPTGAPPPSPSPAVAPGETSRPVAPAVVLDPLPASVRLGTPFTVRWRVTGGAGTPGTSTTVEVQAADGSDVVRSVPSGPFLLPARFEAAVVPASAGTLPVVAVATLVGRELRARATVQVRSGSPPPPPMSPSPASWLTWN